MASKTYTAKRFTPVELANGKTITAIRNEFKRLEYEALLDGELVGYFERFALAEAALDAAYAASVEALPATLDEAVACALDDMELEHRQYEATARQAGLAEEAKHWLRNANAYAAARTQYEAGVRPVALGNRAYVLPSQRPGGASHLLRFDGDWTCSCKAGSSAHWALMLLIGIERATDDIQRFDDALVALDEPEGDDCPKCRRELERDLGARITAARRLAMARV